MTDLRVQPPVPPRGPLAIGHDHRGQQERRDQEGRQQEPHRGAEELAVALDEAGRGALLARFEQDGDGAPRVRIIDRERGETVAVLTPEELRELAERTGLPPGLLLQVSS